jgi:hypothetical protein
MEFYCQNHKAHLSGESFEVSKNQIFCGECKQTLDWYRAGREEHEHFGVEVESIPVYPTKDVVKLL